jgi:hypothetical protein
VNSACFTVFLIPGGLQYGAFPSISPWGIHPQPAREVRSGRRCSRRESINLGPDVGRDRGRGRSQRADRRGLPGAGGPSHPGARAPQLPRRRVRDRGSLAGLSRLPRRLRGGPATTGRGARARARGPWPAADPAPARRVVHAPPRRPRPAPRSRPAGERGLDPRLLAPRRRGVAALRGVPGGRRPGDRGPARRRSSRSGAAPLAGPSHPGAPRRTPPRPAPRPASPRGPRSRSRPPGARGLVRERAPARHPGHRRADRRLRGALLAGNRLRAAPPRDGGDLRRPRRLGLRGGRHGRPLRSAGRRGARGGRRDPSSARCARSTCGARS